MFLALAGLASISVGGDSRPPEATKPPSEITPSAETMRVADWVSASGDNHSLPYIIVDKTNAALFLFSAKGKSLGEAPVLIGVAVGDDASPGIGSMRVTDSLAPRILSLPMYAELGERQIDFVSTCVHNSHVATQISIAD